MGGKSVFIRGEHIFMACHDILIGDKEIFMARHYIFMRAKEIFKACNDIFMGSVHLSVSVVSHKVCLIICASVAKIILTT